MSEIQLLEALPLESYSPPVKISRLELPQGPVFVVRDDLLEGGTKQRAAIPFLQHLYARGAREFVYASPFAGFAQVALATAASAIGFTMRIYAERDQTQRGVMAPHAFTTLAAKAGARIILCDDLSEAESRSSAYAEMKTSTVKIPLGLNTPAFRELLAQQVRAQWKILSRQLSVAPKNLWLPVGSGTLAQIFAGVVPNGVNLRCVNVRVLAASDPRIQAVAKLPNASLIETVENFEDPCAMPPPLPSNVHYDAKLWRFIAAQAQPNDVWWNVAR